MKGKIKMENNNLTPRKEETAVFGTKELNNAVEANKKSKRKNLIRGFVGFFSFIVFFILIATNGGAQGATLAIALFLMFLSFGCLIANIVSSIKMKSQTRKNQKITRQKQNEHLQELKNQGFILDTQVKHIYGLNTAEDMLCRIEVWKDSYKFKMNNINFSLSREKVTDIAIKTETEVQQQYVSSIGGAVLGGALFGTVGAAYGGRAKKKEIYNFKSFLVFTYTGENSSDIKNIIFGTSPEVDKIVSDFYSNRKSSNNVNIEL